MCLSSSDIPNFDFLYAFFEKHYGPKFEIIPSLEDTIQKCCCNFDTILFGKCDTLIKEKFDFLNKLYTKLGGESLLVKTDMDRKGTGAYFTPVYIVDYIVKETLGKLIGKSVEDIEKLKICDPCFGSGIFLLRAHDYLVQEMVKVNDKYSVEQLSKKALSCLYGVDINPKSVEAGIFFLRLNHFKHTIKELLDDKAGL